MRRCLGNRARAFGLLSPSTGAPILAMLVVVSCVPNTQPLWPALTGESAAGPAAVPYVPAAAIVLDWPSALRLNDGEFEPTALSALGAGYSRLAERLRDLRADLSDVADSIASSDRRLQQLRAAAAEGSTAYVDIVTRIDEALRATPEPADPLLQRRWRQALAALDRLARDDTSLARLVDRISADVEIAAEIAETLRDDIDLSEASAAERSARDRLLGDADMAASILAAMRDEAAEDLAAKRAYIAAERANLQILRLAISNGEPYGISLAILAAAGAVERIDEAGAPAPGDSPLVVIRFDNDAVRYAQPLYRAATLALERRADALFTLVAVAPDDVMAEARDHAGAVRRTLSEMGLPDEQIAEADWIDPAVAGAEVHLYVR